MAVWVFSGATGESVAGIFIFRALRGVPSFLLLGFLQSFHYSSSENNFPGKKWNNYESHYYPMIIPWVSHCSSPWLSEFSEFSGWSLNQAFTTIPFAALSQVVLCGKRVQSRAAGGHGPGWSNSWMVCFMENPNRKWMIWCAPNFFRNPPCGCVWKCLV